MFDPFLLEYQYCDRVACYYYCKPFSNQCPVHTLRPLTNTASTIQWIAGKQVCGKTTHVMKDVQAWPAIVVTNTHKDIWLKRDKPVVFVDVDTDVLNHIGKAWFDLQEKLPSQDVAVIIECDAFESKEFYESATLLQFVQSIRSFQPILHVWLLSHTSAAVSPAMQRCVDDAYYVYTTIKEGFNSTRSTQFRDTLPNMKKVLASEWVAGNTRQWLTCVKAQADVFLTHLEPCLQ